MSENFEMMKAQIKENILLLINNGKIPEAQNLLDEYKKIVSGDIEIYSMQCVIDINTGNLVAAENMIQQGLAIDQKDFDLQYNLAYLYEQQENYAGAASLYLQLSQGEYLAEQIDLARQSFERLNEQYTDAICAATKCKVVIFVKTGMDNFTDDIINGLADEYEITKVLVTDLRQIDEEMPKADICWFEWCDELIIHGSQLEIARKKKIICRLHRYEAFSNYVQMVAWENVDKVIFVAEHIRDVVVEKAKLPLDKCEVVYNGIDLDKFKYVERKKGFKLAWIGYLNLRKNPMLVIQYFKELVKTDKRYQLHIAGSFQDEALFYYVRDIVDRLKLNNNIHFDGFIPHEKMNEWLKDKNYIVTGSIGEGHPVGVMEAMASGLKPVIHFFPGVESFYPTDYIYYDLAGFKNIILENKYNSSEYKSFIQNNYSLAKQTATIKNIFRLLTGKLSLSIVNENTIKDAAACPLVTIGVINYNQEKYIEECLESILNQDYPNKEILVIDDCSTDKSLDIINKYTSTYENIRLIKHDVNSGSGSKGVQDVQIHAKGKYFTFIDADDYYAHNDVITSWVNVAEGNKKLDFVYGNFVIVNQTGAQLDVWKYKDFDRNQVICDVFNRFGSGVMPLIGLYKKDFYKKNKLTWHYDKELKIGYDTINCLINLKNNWQYKYLDKDCLCYRRHENNVTSNSKERIRCALTMAEYIANNYAETIYLPQIRWQEVKEKKFKKAVKAFYLGTYFMQAYKQFAGIDTAANWQFTGDGIALQEVLRPLEDKIEEYFKKSLKEHNIFAEDIAENRAEFKAITTELAKGKPHVITEQVSLPKVSIIIPTYNRRDFLEQALESVLAQDYENLEIVVSDNASTDDTQDMMEDFSLDKRIKYHRNEQNIGSLENHRQALYKLSTGEYALILSDDDYLIDNSYITKAIAMLLANPQLALVHANCKILNMDTNEFTNTNLQTPRITKGIEYFLNYESPGYGHICGFITSVFNRRIAIELGCLYEESWAIDLFLNLNMMLAGDIGVIDDYVAVCRQHKGSNSNNLESKYDYGTISELEKIKEKAVKRKVPLPVLEQWLTLRVFKYVRWSLLSYFENGNHEIGIEFLNSIKSKYPEAYQEVRRSFGL